MREAGQGRNPAALSEVGCVLFFVYLTIPLKSNIKGLFLKTKWVLLQSFKSTIK